MTFDLHMHVYSYPYPGPGTYGSARCAVDEVREVDLSAGKEHHGRGEDTREDPESSDPSLAAEHVGGEQYGLAHGPQHRADRLYRGTLEQSPLLAQVRSEDCLCCSPRCSLGCVNLLELSVCILLRKAPHSQHGNSGG